MDLYRPRDLLLSAKLVPTFADRGVSGSQSRLSRLGSATFFFQVAPQLYSRRWRDPVPDPLLLRKSGSTGNRTRVSRSVARKSKQLDQRGDRDNYVHVKIFACIYTWEENYSSNFHSENIRESNSGAVNLCHSSFLHGPMSLNGDLIIMCENDALTFGSSHIRIQDTSKCKT
jgi:hypothetical protein